MKNAPMNMADPSVQRAMLALQQEQMQLSMQEQLMQREMYMQQQLMAQQQQYEQQMYQMMQQQQRQMQQQYQAANLTADDVRQVMQSIKPGESFSVEMVQRFDVQHKKHAHVNGAQITLLLVLLIIGFIAVGS